MGDIADDMIDGLSCSGCGIYFVKEHGYPVLCQHCKRHDRRSPTPEAIEKELGDCSDEEAAKYGWKTANPKG